MVLQWQVNDQLSIAFDGSLTDAEYTSLHPGVGTFQVGDPLDSVAKYSYTASVDYDFSWSPSVVGFAYLGYNRQGPSSATARGIFAVDSVETDAIGFLNMRVGAEWNAFTLSLFGRNLTNEKRPNIVQTVSIDSFSTQSRLRSIGVSLSYRF